MSPLSRAFVLFVVGFPLAAQDPAPATPAENTPRKWGVGVSLSPVAVFIDESLGIIPFGFTNILVPFRISPSAILEPEIGLFRTSRESGSTSTSFSNTRLGIGVLLGLKERAGLHPYVGPRFGYSRTTTKNDSQFGGSSSSKQSSWQFSGVFGAQHFFSPHFSLGGEAQLTRVSAGDEEFTPPIQGSEGSQTFVTTTGLITLRWFF